MRLLKYDRYKTISIWQLRGHDNTVLINDSQITDKIKHYRIIFTKNKEWAGREFYLPYRAIKRSRKEWHKSASGQDILRYCVPVDKLEDLVIDKQDWRMLV